MSEKLSGHERKTGDFEDSHSEKAVETHHHAPKHESKEVDLEQVQEKVEQATPTESVVLKKKMDIVNEEQTYLPPDKSLKQHAARVYLSKVRSQLKGSDKYFSKFIHNSKIDSVSEISGKTLIRPSGVLCGGIVTLIGSSYYLYLTRHDGLKYSFSIALFLFVSGFVLGLLLEFVYKLIISRR